MGDHIQQFVKIGGLGVAVRGDAALPFANAPDGSDFGVFGQLYDAFKTELATEEAEKDLATIFNAVSLKVAPLMADKNYQAALSELAQLKTPIDTFFDSVMVMSDDEAVKINRLTLLNEIRNSFFAIADISLL